LVRTAYLQRTEPLTSAPLHPAPIRWSLLALALAALFAFLAPPAQAKPRCHGKKATIVSNAPRIVGSKAPDVIVAGGRDNAIFGEGGNDVICGGGGDDVIYGGRGKDTLLGNGGEDRLHGERGSDRLSGGGGRDLLFGETGNDHLNGGAGVGDRVNAGPGDDTLDGGSGDFDVLIGGPGNDRIDGGPGAHDIASYAGTGGAVTVDLRRQTVNGAEGERMSGIEDAIGGSGGDTLIGNPSSANRLDGGPGGDRLLAGGPGDQAFGGPGSDHCEGGFAGEISCGPGQSGAGTAVELYASIDGETSLIVTGSERADAALLSYSGGAFVVQRQPGGGAILSSDPTSPACVATSDAVSCAGRVTSTLVSLGGGNDSFAMTDSVPPRVFSIIDGGGGSDALRGGRADDVLYAGDDRAPDSLEGGGGDDVIYGVNIFHPRKDSGAARMIGGPGSDLLIGGQPCGGDLFDGGPGPNDSASFARVKNGGIVVKATIGGAVLDPDVSGCNAGRISSSVEKIEGSTGRDVLAGDGSANVLLGRGGNDRLDGRGGRDTCVGGTGRDRARNCEQRHSIP
jgi:Ca2+-binding RTX toxin-like protein